jgi:hypothetical protein
MIMGAFPTDRQMAAVADEYKKNCVILFFQRPYSTLGMSEAKEKRKIQ